MKGDGIRQKVKATGGARPPSATRGWTRPSPRTARTCSSRPTRPCRRRGVRRRGQGRRHRGREEGVRALPDRLGAHRAGRRVLRRHRPEGRRPRGRPGERARSGPAGTGWRRPCGRTRRSAPRRRRSPTSSITDLTDWQKRVGKAEITPTSMANGAKELLDEVATGKVTGEEERYSPHRPGRLQGQRRGRAEVVRAAEAGRARRTTPALVTELDKQFAALNTLLDKYRTDKAVVRLHLVRQGRQGASARSCRDGVNALAEPLSKLAAAVVEVSGGVTMTEDTTTGRRQTADSRRTRRRPPGARCSAGAVPGSRSAPPRPAARRRGRAPATTPSRPPRPRRGAAVALPRRRTRPASPPPCRTGCTSPRST